MRSAARAELGRHGEQCDAANFALCQERSVIDCWCALCFCRCGKIFRLLGSLFTDTCSSVVLREVAPDAGLADVVQIAADIFKTFTTANLYSLVCLAGETGDALVRQPSRSCFGKSPQKRRLFSDLTVPDDFPD